jgi:hypothetical protein
MIYDDSMDPAALYRVVIACSRDRDTESITGNSLEIFPFIV